MSEKVGIFINSRSEYACLLSVIRHAEKMREDIDPVIVLGGEFADANPRIFDGHTTDGGWRLHTLVHNRLSSHATMARSAAMMAMDTTTVVAREAFSKAILVGDRYDTLGAAMTLAYMGVRIFHVQGGEESGNIDESIRHAITKLAHVHLVANNKAAENVKKLGENPEYVVVTGCPSLDLFNQPNVIGRGIEKSFLPEILNGMGIGQDLATGKPYIVVIYHPETFLKPTQIGVFIEALASLTGYQKIILHPNAEPWSDHILKALKTAVLEGALGQVRLISYIEPDIFASILSNASCLIGNSSAGIRQSAFIGLPVVNLGSRQTGRLHEQNVFYAPIGHSPGGVNLVSSAISTAMRIACAFDKNIYGDGRSATRILEAVLKMDPPAQKRLHYSWRYS